MLSNEDRAAVQQEFEKEQFRLSLRPRWKVILDSLSNPFLLWVLSAVILASLTGLGTIVAAAYQNHVRALEHDKHLRAEIAARWNRLYYMTNSQTAESTFKANMPTYAHLLGIDIGNEAVHQHLIYPEFDSESLMALLVELEADSDLDIESKRAIKELRFELMRLSKYFSRYPYSPNETPESLDKSMVNEVATFQIHLRKALGKIGYQGDIAQPPDKGYLPDFVDP